MQLLFKQPGSGVTCQRKNDDDVNAALGGTECWRHKAKSPIFSVENTHINVTLKKKCICYTVAFLKSIILRAIQRGVCCNWSGRWQELHWVERIGCFLYGSNPFIRSQFRLRPKITVFHQSLHSRSVHFHQLVGAEEDKRVLSLNKLASLKASQVWNYDWPTNRLTGWSGSIFNENKWFKDVFVIWRVRLAKELANMLHCWQYCNGFKGKTLDLSFNNAWQCNV